MPTPPRFRCIGLSPEPFEPLFALDDAALHARGIRRRRADEAPGYPCRVSLEEAQLGDELLLLNWTHQPARSPYHASGPIFVRRGVAQARLAPGVVPESVLRRLISLRAYDAGHGIVEGLVLEGRTVAAQIEAMFERDDVAYLHLHNARQGCFACAVERA